MHFQCSFPEFETKRCCLKWAIRKFWITFNMHKNKRLFRRMAEGHGCRSNIMAHKIAILQHQVAEFCTCHSYWWVWVPLDLSCLSELQKINLCLALHLLFLLLIPNQELLDWWVLIQEHRCNCPKACSHPVHNNVLNQCVASTAILEGGGQYWVEVATWVVKCYKKKTYAKLYFIVMMCKKVYHASSKVTQHLSFSCVKCTMFRSGCGAAKIM